MNHLELVRISRRRPGVHRLHPWTFQRENTSLGRFVKEEPPPWSTCKPWPSAHLSRQLRECAGQLGTQGLKTCQMGLRFGGNDVGSIMIEENVVSAAAPITRPARRSSAASSAMPLHPSSATRYTALFLN